MVTGKPNHVHSLLYSILTHVENPRLELLHTPLKPAKAHFFDFAPSLLVKSSSALLSLDLGHVISSSLHTIATFNLLHLTSIPVKLLFILKYFVTKNSKIQRQKCAIYGEKTAQYVCTQILLMGSASATRLAKFPP